MNIEDIRAVEIDFVDLEEVYMPAIVYKYRTWNVGDSNSDNVLLKNQLFLASPSSFVDESDCRIPIRYDLLTDQEILIWSERTARRMFPKYNDDAIKREVQHYIGRIPFRNKEKMNQYDEQEWIDYNNNAGVLSLCIQSLNEDMWKMYGDDHKGICYGFSTIELIRGCNLKGGGVVRYVNELPIIHPFEDTILKANKRVYYKFNSWSFEEEYRIRDFTEQNQDPRNRIKTYPDHVLKEVTLGKDFDDGQIPVIIEHLRSKEVQPTLFRCVVVDNRLTREHLNY